MNPPWKTVALKTEPGGPANGMTTAQHLGRPSDSPKGGLAGRDLEDAEQQRRSIRRALWIGVWTWPSFTILDVFMCYVVHPQAPFRLFLVYRIALEFALVGAYRASKRPAASIPGLKRVHAASFFGAAVLVSLMALELGGIGSPYLHGISIVILVRSTVMPDHWRRSLPVSIAFALAFPAVMGAAALASPASYASWSPPGAVANFVSHYVFVLSSAVLGLAAGHAVWAAQRQVYRARRLGRFRLQAPIGEGGMGEVWLAWDETERRAVVLKILRSESAPDPSAVQRFEREAYATSLLHGQHTVRVYDFGASDDGVYFIAMEHLRGIDLAELVRTHGYIPPGRAIRFIIQACESLAEAHAVGIIHRDIKPENLFVTRVGDDHDFIKLLDFGVALVLDAHPAAQLTQTGLFPGTPPYLAPELWHGAPADPRSDIYALGTTLYFLLTRVTPFTAVTPQAFLAAHVEADPLRPSLQRRQALPPGLDDLVLRCLSKRPADRFQSVVELRNALTQLASVPAWTQEDARAFWQHTRSNAAAEI